MKNKLTPWMISAVLAVAFGPLLVGFFGPDWRARWILAWAANEYQNGAPDEAEQALQRASELSNSIVTDSDFWKLKFDMVFNKENPKSDVIAKLYEESHTLISRTPKQVQSSVATFVGQLFHLNQAHGYAVKIMEAYYGPISARDPVENNSLAYFRSLEGRDLKTALLEIDAALVADGTAREEYLDTKAWVLHRLHRNAEALPFAEQAIKRLGAQIKRYSIIPAKEREEFASRLLSNPKTKNDKENQDKENQETEPADEDAASQAKASIGSGLEELRNRFPQINPALLDQEVKKVASLRFHRACILDELGRSEESEADYQWLDLFGFVDTAKIF